MNIQALKTLSNEIHTAMPWLQGIRDHEQYLELMELMDTLVEDYEENHVLIDLLFPVLERYEEESEHFQEFNAHIDSLDAGIATLRVLIDQYRLTLSDLPEIGGKSLVSLILSGKRQLTVGHIKALSERFGVPKHMFI
ncbi:TPA: transcriptional regulator [Vibrio parahaemolyticus]|nr:transcriptional regulator [Vibrio parahaemolyticus]HAV1982858.1 transcriptional regulator [Vibrio parahaemolyticus]